MSTRAHQSRGGGDIYCSRDGGVNVKIGKFVVAAAETLQSPPPPPTAVSCNRLSCLIYMKINRSAGLGTLPKGPVAAVYRRRRLITVGLRKMTRIPQTDAECGRKIIILITEHFIVFF